MATGTGKTFTAVASIGFLTQQLSVRNKSSLVVIVAPYIHVVDQWIQSLKNQNQIATAAYESKELWFNTLSEQVAGLHNVPGRIAYVVTTITTFKTKAFQRVLGSLFSIDLVFVADEVHHFGAQSLARMLPTKAKYRLGLSATPERHQDEIGTQKIFDFFSGVVYQLDIKTAIERNILTKYEYIPRVCTLTEDETLYYSEITDSISAIMKGRDFSELSRKELDKVMMLLRLRSAVLGTCLDKQIKFLADFKTNAHLKNQLVYCSQGTSPVNMEIGKHIQYIHDQLMDIGVTAARYEAATPRSERLRILEEFTQGKIDTILSMKCLDEAVDIPSASVCYFLASGTNPREFIQRRGRVLRKHAAKDKAVVYDYITVPNLVNRPSFLEVETAILIRELDRARELADAALNSEEATKILEGIRIGE
jgi:superfamily II DNA or RNA helicase